MNESLTFILGQVTYFQNKIAELEKQKDSEQKRLDLTIARMMLHKITHS